jgi:hypothetical protein
MAKAILIASAVLSTSLAVAPTASADRKPPPNPAIAQYIELVPTSGGAVVPSGHARARLSKRIAEQLPRGPEGTALRNLATAAAYGAPQHTFHASKDVSVEARRVVLAPKAQREGAAPKSGVSSASFGAAVDAVGARRSTVLWLGLVLLATAALGIFAAVARTRR